MSAQILNFIPPEPGTPPYVPFPLSPAQVYHAGKIGLARRCQNMELKRDTWHLREKQDRWAQHMDGACAEYAVSLYLNLPWDGALGNLDAPDVGPYEVRYTPYVDGKLILRREDKSYREFILVRGICPNFEIIGWILGSEGKRIGEISAGDGRRVPVHFVKEHQLRCILEIKTRHA